MKLSLLPFALAALAAAAPAHAVQVRSDYTQVDSNTWTMDLTVVNDGTPSFISGFTVYFPVGRFTQLLLSGSPLGWDTLLVGPDAGLPAPGFLDSFRADPSQWLSAGQSLGGFQVRFDIVGGGQPGALAFDINDLSYNVVASGLTTVTVVPEPSTTAMLALGIGAFLLRRRAAR